MQGIMSLCIKRYIFLVTFMQSRARCIQQTLLLSVLPVSKFGRLWTLLSMSKYIKFVADWEYHPHHVCSEQQRATWGENSCWLGWSRGGRCAGVPPLPHAAAWQGHCPGGKAGADMYSWEFSMFGGNKETICEIFEFILVFCIIYDCDPRMLREISFLQLTPQIEMENVKWSKSSNVHRIQNRIPANLLGLAHKFWINYLFSNR